MRIGNYAHFHVLSSSIICASCLSALTIVSLVILSPLNRKLSTPTVGSPALLVIDRNALMPLFDNVYCIFWIMLVVREVVRLNQGLERSFNWSAASL